MDFLRFIKWMWNKNSDSDKGLFLFFSWVGVCFLGLFFFNFNIILAVFFIGIIFALVFLFLYRLGKAIKDQWDRFKDEREREAQLIVDKLTSIGREKSSADEILDKLRARQKKSV